MVSEPPSRYAVFKGFVQAFAYAGGVLALFFVVHLTASRIDWFLRRWTRSSLFPLLTAHADAIRAYVPTVKTFIFIGAVAILCIPITIDLYRKLRVSKIADMARGILSAVLISFLLYLLVYRPVTDSMGTNYALLARSPFTQPSSVHNTRLLMPALAYLFFLRDFRPYYIFSAVLTIAFIALLSNWGRNQAQLNWWQIVSLCTCSFVIYQYQYGGYPDILVYTLFILVMQEFIRPAAKLSLLILALLTHEASVLVGSVLAWRYLDHRRQIGYVLAIVLYLLVWYWASGNNIEVMLRGRQVQGLSGLTWLSSAFGKWLLGVLVAYKAVWIALLVALWIAAKKRLFPEMAFILACVVAGLAMTVMGVDTSRLMGFAFPGVLTALAIVARELDLANSRRFLTVIFLLNLLLPSFNIGLNGGIEFFPGLYKSFYDWFAATMAELMIHLF